MCDLRGMFKQGAGAGKSLMDFTVAELSEKGSRFLSFLPAETAQRCFTTVAMYVDTLKDKVSRMGEQLRAQAQMLVRCL